MATLLEPAVEPADRPLVLPETEGGLPPSPAAPDASTLLLLAGALALLVVLAWPVLTQWISAYLQPDSYYAYGPVVPFIVGLMLWHRRKALGAVPKTPSYGAMLLLLPALALLLIGEKQEIIAVGSLGLMLSLWSGAWLVLGGRWVRAAAFPLAFLVWMAPLPGPLLHSATFGSQQLSTVLADKTLHLLSFQTVLQGNVITLESFQLFVDEPCSGFRLLLTLLVVSAAFAWLADGPPLRRLALFAFSLPLAIAVNVARLTVLAVVGESFGAHAEHAIHDPSGLMMVALGLVVLFALARRIGCRTFAGWPLL